MPTLLIFGAYPRVIIESPPSLSILKYGEAIYKVMIILCKMTVEYQITEALNTRNSLLTVEVLALPLQSEVCI